MGKKEIGLKEFTDGFEQALLKIMDLGGAVPGDKTMGGCSGAGCCGIEEIERRRGQSFRGNEERSDGGQEGHEGDCFHGSKEREIPVSEGKVCGSSGCRSYVNVFFV